MTLPGETIGSGGPNVCEDCKTHVKPEVLQSAAGYYIGTWCKCGPYSRESGYYDTKAMAQVALANNDYQR